MIDCNKRGGRMVIAGLASGFAVGGITGLFTRNDSLPYALAAIVALPLPTALDLWYRWGHYRHFGRWRYLVPDAGGSFMFLPVWLWFGAWPTIGLALWSAGVL